LAPLDGAAAFTAKKQLLNETGVVIWRNHDRIHGGSPDRYKRPYMDGIFYGVMKELGWENHAVRFHNKPLIFRIPETTGLRLAQELMEKMNLNGIRVEGDPDCKVRKVFFCEHVRGWNVDFETIHLIESEDIDAIIPLETVDWTVSLYVRDSVQLGRPRVMLEAGHFNFEELGMKHMLTWLPKLLGGTVPVHYVQSGDGFMYLKRADSQKI
jgi:hypothetical protein